MEMKLCDKCKYKVARVHITQIDKNDVSHIHLCNECAQERGISVDMGNEEIPLECGSGACDTGPAKEKTIVCPQCRNTFRFFKEKGLLGCSSCYDSFNDEIQQILTQTHGTVVHKGKAYFRSMESIPHEDELECLKKELACAVQDEKFEAAALLIDKIHSVTARQPEKKPGR